MKVFEESSPVPVEGGRSRPAGNGHVQRRVLNKYGRVQNYVLGTSYMYAKRHLVKVFEESGPVPGEGRLSVAVESIRLEQDQTLASACIKARFWPRLEPTSSKSL